MQENGCRNALERSVLITHNDSVEKDSFNFTDRHLEPFQFKGLSLFWVHLTQSYWQFMFKQLKEHYSI